MTSAPFGESDSDVAPCLNAAARVEETDEAARRRAPRAMESTDIFKGEKTVEISHNGVIYRLQATRLGKLILTK